MVHHIKILKRLSRIRKKDVPNVQKQHPLAPEPCLVLHFSPIPLKMVDLQSQTQSGAISEDEQDSFMSTTPLNVFLHRTAG